MQVRGLTRPRIIPHGAHNREWTILGDADLDASRTEGDSAAVRLRVERPAFLGHFWGNERG